MKKQIVKNDSWNFSAFSDRVDWKQVNSQVSGRIHYCCSVSQLCPTFVTPWTVAHPDFPVLHHLLELAQTHVHWVGDAIHPTISSFVIPFFSCLQSSPASGFFLMSQLFASGGQSIGGASALASVLPVNIQGWFPLGLTGLLSLQPKALKSLLLYHNSKSINSSALSLLYGPNLTSVHDSWKTVTDYMDLLQQSNVSAFKYAL